jgi:hypothetical protein
MLSEGLNSIIGVRLNASANKKGDKWGYMVRLAGTDQPLGTGDLFVFVVLGDQPLIAKADEIHLNRGEWYKFEVIAQGPRIQIVINDKTVVDFVDPLRTFSTGPIALICRPGSTARFRNLEIKELQPTVYPEAPVAKPAAQDNGFVSLFNGKDLRGWKTHPSQPGNWRVWNDAIVGSGNATSHLYTERGDYKDFHLRVEARINDGGNSGLMFRTPFGPTWPANNPRFPGGYEAQIDCTRPPATGSLYAGADGAVVSLKESPVPPNQWFAEEVIAQGNHIIVKVNGKVTADFTDEKGRTASGHIALQQHDPQTVAQFRKIEIKELGVK